MLKKKILHINTRGYVIATKFDRLLQNPTSIPIEKEKNCLEITFTNYPVHVIYVRPRHGECMLTESPKTLNWEVPNLPEPKNVNLSSFMGVYIGPEIINIWVTFCRNMVDGWCRNTWNDPLFVSWPYWNGRVEC